MAEPTGYPSYVYNAEQHLAVIVHSAEELEALTANGDTWTTDPVPPPTPIQEEGWLRERLITAVLAALDEPPPEPEPIP